MGKRGARVKASVFDRGGTAGSQRRRSWEAALRSNDDPELQAELIQAAADAEELKSKARTGLSISMSEIPDKNKVVTTLERRRMSDDIDARVREEERLRTAAESAGVDVRTYQAWEHLFEETAPRLGSLATPDPQ